MKSGKVFLGVLAGAATGALAGILFAPAKGSKTREKITRKTEDYLDAVKETFNELIDSVTEKFEKVKEDVSEYAENKLGKPVDAENVTKTFESRKV